jgi:hypothetical protein
MIEATVLITSAIRPPCNMPFLEMKDAVSRLIATKMSIFSGLRNPPHPPLRGALSRKRARGKPSLLPSWEKVAEGRMRGSFPRGEI